MDKEIPYAIEMIDITKRFPGIIANDHITLQLKKGEIHALLGENGAGKSTLMSVLFGSVFVFLSVIYFPAFSKQYTVVTDISQCIETVLFAIFSLNAMIK